MVVLCTEQWSGLGFALLMQRQGSHVIVAHDYAKVKPDDLAATKFIGNGLVRKMPFAEATRRYTDKGALWLFDGNELSEHAETLRKQGELVIGSSALSHKLEEDRDFASQVAESLGFQLPLTEKFHDVAKAERFLEQHSDKAFVYKPDKGDPTATYVPQATDDPQKANQELQEYVKHLPKGGGSSFILQEVIQGTEVAFDLWVRNGQPVAAFCDLEAKRKLVGDLGANIGCAGDYVFRIPVDSPGVEATVAKYLVYPPVKSYTGTMDVNVIVKDGVPYFIENGWRFGYNAYCVMFQALAQGSMEEILRAWVAGSQELDGAFSDQIGASLTLVVDNVTRGIPLLLPPEIQDSVYQYRGFLQDDSLAVVEGWPEVAVAVSAGSSVTEAGHQCLSIAQQVGIPGKGYRTDLVTTDGPKLPLTRYRALQQLGWLPDAELEQAVLAFLATLT